MRFFYLDTGLRGDLGHHGNACKVIVEALARRGIRARVFASREVTSKLQRTLGARPHFRFHTYGAYDRDPVSGLLNNFELIWMGTCEDLERLGAMSPQDIVFVSTVLPAQFMALVRWAGALLPHRRPNVVMEFGLPLPVGGMTSGSESGPDIDALMERMLYRHVMLHFTPELARRFHLVNFDPAVADAYAQLLGVQVHVVPFPRGLVTSRRRRGGAQPVTIAFMGHQRSDKGYALVPELLPLLLAARPDIRLLIHNGAPREMPQVQEAIRNLARDDRRIIVDERAVDATQWANLLDQADLVVCPYDPRHFAAGHSSVAAEALANGIPLVVPAKTPIAALAERYGLPGTLIESYSAAATLDAVLRAVDGFPGYAEAARRAAQRWQETQGPFKFVDAVFELVERSQGAVPEQLAMSIWSKSRLLARSARNTPLAQTVRSLLLNWMGRK